MSAIDKEDDKRPSDDDTTTSTSPDIAATEDVLQLRITTTHAGLNGPPSTSSTSAMSLPTSASSSPDSTASAAHAADYDTTPPAPLPTAGSMKRTNSAKEAPTSSGLTPPTLNRSKTTIDGPQTSPTLSPALQSVTSATTPTSASYSSSTLQNQVEISSVVLPPDAIKEVEEDKHSHTVFSLEVRLASGLRWIIEKRYSDFREFHERMKKANPAVRNLAFPKRQIFRSKSSAVIEQRRSDLEKYLKDILGVTPLMKVPIFNFLSVYAHLESYDRKKRRQQKEIDLRRMKNLLPSDELEDIQAAFTRLCSSKHFASSSDESSSNDKPTEPASPAPTSAPSLLVTGPLSTQGSMLQLLDPKENVSINKTAFRRDVLSVFPDMPSTFAMRLLKGISDKQHSDICMDEFVRAIAILRHGSVEDQLAFAYQMCDHDHMGKLQSTGLGNLLICIYGRTLADKPEYKRLLNEVFDYGRVRLGLPEFVTEIQKQPLVGLLIDWMPRFMDVLCESADPKLLELQEEYNPVVQQKILEAETLFSIKEIGLLQEAFHAYRSSSPDEAIDVEALANDFPLDMSDARLLTLFASFGPRANGVDVDVFSFIHALSIACRGSAEAKMHFGFTVFASESTLNHEDLFAMLQLEVLQHTSMASTIEHYMQTEASATESTRRDVLSSAQLGQYVDHILEAFGANGELTLDQFCAWATAVQFRIAALDRIKQTVFVQLGLIPMNKQEEIEVAKLCYREYNPAELVEDDHWYILEQSWYDHWRKYVGFVPMVALRGNPAAPKSSAVVVAPSPAKPGSALGSPASNKTGLLAKHTTKTPPPVSAPKDETPSSILDSDKNVIRPKYIANATLLNKEKVFAPNDDMLIGKHFVVVHEQLWLGLKQWYGGGPEIKKTVIVLSNGQTTLNLWNSEDEKDETKLDEHALALATKQPLSATNGLTKRVRAGASVGLVNLGNTCYMNSALQCIGNTPLLIDYFLSGMYIHDINRTSTLGMQGKLAEVYGKLAEDMWSAKYKSISPREFKKTIGKFNEAFRGSDQQDAQELIAFLLSGLSEDLNRILDKPYIEHPDSDGRFDSDLADEWWRNSLKREVSIIVALFTGQYKSLLTCSQCGYKSARFEPFTFLQLPLPEPTHNNVTIRLAFAADRMPLKLSLRLPIDATVFDLKKQLADLCVAEFDLPTTTIADIKICEFQGSLILGFKADTRKLAQIRSIDRLLAFQLEPLAPRVMDMTRSRRPSILAEMPSGQPTSSTTDGPVYVTEGSLIEVQHKGEYLPATILSIDTPEFVRVQYRSGEIEADVPHSRLRQRPPRLLYCPVVSRKLGYSPVYFKNPFRPVPFGTPDLVRLCPEVTTGIDLYTMVWQRVQRYLKKELSPPQEVAATTNEIVVCDSIDAVFCHKDVPHGFVLRRVDAKGLTDTRTPWLARSFGSTIPCTDQMVDLLEDETIAIDWDVQVLQDHVDMDFMKGVEMHASVAKNNALDNGPVPLSHCLDAFTSEEKIQEGYCSSCRQHQEMTKKLEIWRLPPVMVIQLKRFQYTQTYRRKLASLVQFPVHGLDLSSCVAPFEEFPARYPEKLPSGDASAAAADPADASSDAADVAQNRIRRGYTNTNLEQSRCLETHYDMYGVVNHQGALGGGHYTAYAKNSVDGNWYSYDDDRVRLIEESKVVTSSAYLCFYVRKDMDDLSVDTIFPPKKDGKITEEDINRFVEESDKGKCAIM